MRVIGWGVIGFLLGGAVAFGLGLVWLTFINTDNREGAAAMGVAFFWTPLGAVAGAITGGILGLRR